jgi:glutaconate CoA-transferase subunit A
MARDKVLPLPEAIRTLVHDGDSIALEGFSHLIPFAAGHEIIRQGRRGLTFCRMTPDLLSDMMIAAGCVDRLVCSFFASGSAGALHEIRRRIEHHDPAPLEVEEYSHHAMVLRYHAGASRLPFIPIRSYAGSDLPAINPDIRLVDDPYGEGSVYVVPPLNPDVTIVHAQRADRRGNVQIWGITGVQQEAVYAADRVIVTVEEIVDDEVVRSDPYDRDNAFYRMWPAMAKDSARLQEWLDTHVRGTADHTEYLASIGEEQLAPLTVAPRLSQPVDYGRRMPAGATATSEAATASATATTTGGDR